MFLGITADAVASTALYALGLIGLVACLLAAIQALTAAPRRVPTGRGARHGGWPGVLS
jgi:hypothetical protein